jgi:pimeloyl-ACP methyl ester carboxylesterase
MMELELPQGPIRYRDEGRGPTLLFVHGLLTAGDVWSDVVAELSKAYRCITPDWPIGSHTVAMNRDADLSPEGIAAVVASFVDELNLRDVTLVGNDSGGAIAQLVLAHHNDARRITRAVLTTCDAFEVFPPKLFSYLRVVAAVPGMTALLTKSLQAMPRLGRLPIAYGLTTKRPVDLSRIERWTAPAARDAGIRRDLVKFLRAAAPAVTIAVANELPRLTLPVLVAWTPEDTSLPIALGNRLAATLPNAELVHIDDARVFSMLDQPRELAAKMSAFLTRTERGGNSVGPRQALEDREERPPGDAVG